MATAAWLQNRLVTPSQCWGNSKSQVFLRKSSKLWKEQRKLEYSQFCAALWRHPPLMIHRAQTADTHRGSGSQISRTNSLKAEQFSVLWCVLSDVFVLPLLSSWQHQWILLCCHKDLAIGFCFRSSSDCKHQPCCSTLDRVDGLERFLGHPYRSLPLLLSDCNRILFCSLRV